jgi:general secretion pathway protein G
MTRTKRSGQEGFTLLELLVVLCILICLIALLVPNLGLLLGKGKEVKAMNDCKRVGEAMATWAILNGSTLTPGYVGGLPPAIDVSQYDPIPFNTLQSLLIPTFISRVPELDPWGNPYQYFLDQGNPAGPAVALCASTGQDGQPNPISGTYTVTDFPVTDFNQEIIWADGNFVRWPR